MALPREPAIDGRRGLFGLKHVFIIVGLPGMSTAWLEAVALENLLSQRAVNHSVIG
jgi:hypothetical protein